MKEEEEMEEEEEVMKEGERKEVRMFWQTN